MRLEVKLLYVDEFQGKGPMPYPEEGQVYRAVKRRAPATNDYYQLVFDDGNSEITGMFLPSLVANTEFFKCKMREVTVEELLDITGDDAVFERVAQWGVDFKDGLDDDLLNVPTMHRVQSSKKLVEVLTEILMKKEGVKAIGDDEISQLKQLEPDTGKAMSDFVQHVLRVSSGLYKGSHTNTPLRVLRASEEHGKGINTYNAYKYLHRYMSEDEEKGNNPVDLYKAMHYLLFELTRLNINGRD